MSHIHLVEAETKLFLRVMNFQHCTTNRDTTATASQGVTLPDTPIPQRQFMRKTCLVIIYFLGILLVEDRLNARIVTLTVGGVRTNDVVTIGTNESLTLNAAGGSISTLLIEKDSITFQFDPYSFDPQYGRLTRGPLAFAGPAKVTLTTSGITNTGPSFVTLEIKPDRSAPSLEIPSNAVVIPADNAGPVTILLESSTDLVTWNPALPGAYGTSSTNRFFRVRAVRAVNP